MANITSRKDKNGNIISYRIRIYKGRDQFGKQLKPYEMTWKPNKNMTAKQIEKELNRQATLFEEKCKHGLVSDGKQTFAEYAEYVMKLKANQGTKRKTLERYEELLERINQGIGYIKIQDIKPQHLNSFYDQLSQNGLRKNTERAICKIDLKAKLSELNLTKQKLHEITGIALATISKVYKQEPVKVEKAIKISNVLKTDYKEIFTIQKDDTPLSNKTILEHHRLISTILEQADKELLIPFNPARKATPPKVKKTNANFFDLEVIKQICIALEEQPLKWKVIAHLFLITGARRSEIVGLKWDNIDFKNSQIHISRDLLYSRKVGIYDDTTKTDGSDRYIKIPKETMDLILEYKQWFLQRTSMYKDRWHNTNYLFFQEKSGNEGKPMHPDSINTWLKSFSKKYNLPHINPHAFRHTMASILIFKNIDCVSISKRLGHSKVSTTTDIYSHIMKQADTRSAESIADIVLRQK